MIRRGQIEVDSAEGPICFRLAEDDRDLFIEGDPVAQIGAAIVVSLDRFLHEGFERFLTFFRRFLEAHDELFVRS